MSTDADFLGLRAGDEPGRYRFHVQNHLARLDGRLYGGTAIAASIVAAEALSERAALWMTTQFVSTAPANEEITVLAEVLAPGRRTNQVRVTGTDGAGAVMFASLGATGHHRTDGLTGTFEHMPTVSPPDDSPARGGPFATMLRNAGIEDVPLPSGVGFASVVEFREPTVEEHPDPGPGRICMWVRRRDRVPVTGRDDRVHRRHGAAVGGARRRRRRRRHQPGQHHPHRRVGPHRVGAGRPARPPGDRRLRHGSRTCGVPRGGCSRPPASRRRCSSST